MYLDSALDITTLNVPVTKISVVGHHCYDLSNRPSKERHRHLLPPVQCLKCHGLTLFSEDAYALRPTGGCGANQSAKV